MRVAIISGLLFFCLSCEQQKKTETLIAQVFENILYRSEISDFIPNGTAPEDSILMAQSYIRNWVTQKLLLQKAIQNLSAEEVNIRRQVEDYRTSLLIHQYKQKLIAQRLMEEVSEQDIENYYTKNQSNFILSTPIVKVLFFILPKNAPKMKDVQKWVKSDKQEHQEDLEAYCLTNARKFDSFGDKWVEAKYLLNLIPGDFNTLENKILTKKNIEEEDEENVYFLKIKDIRREHTVAPLEYVTEEITMILKNKKKILFENELEKQINQEGIRKNYVKIY